MSNFKLKRDDNTGFILADPRPRDWVAGDISGITYEERMSGDWTDFLPSDEYQIGVYFDTMACVTFSALNCIEIQLNWMVVNNKLTIDQILKLKELGILDMFNRANFSDRYIAKLSGTSTSGNTLVNVIDAVRAYGLVSEAAWPYPRLQQTPVFTWDEYYQEIPKSVVDQGKEFLKIFEPKYEFITSSNANIKKHLKQAPIQIAAPVCQGWNTADPIKKCDLTRAGHATTIYKVDDLYYDFDHYKEFRKRLEEDYFVPYAMKILLTLRTNHFMTPDAQELLTKAEKKLVLATPSGRNAYVKGGKRLDAPVLPSNATPGEKAAYRAALMNSAVIRENPLTAGLTVPDAIFDEWPNQPF